MSGIDSAADVIDLLKSIQHNNQHGSSLRLSQQGDRKGIWTAVDFKISSFNYLVPLDQTREIFPVPSQLTPIPKTQSWVYGIANLRGELLPIFDLKSFLTGQNAKLSKRSRVLVINHPTMYSGLLVDDVSGLKHFNTDPIAAVQQQDPRITSYLSGSILERGIHWDVFNFKKLINDQRFLAVTQ